MANKIIVLAGTELCAPLPLVLASLANATECQTYNFFLETENRLLNFTIWNYHLDWINEGEK
jgi:hypothetical protein